MEGAALLNKTACDDVLFLSDLLLKEMSPSQMAPTVAQTGARVMQGRIYFKHSIENSLSLKVQRRCVLSKNIACKFCPSGKHVKWRPQWLISIRREGPLPVRTPPPSPPPGSPASRSLVIPSPRPPHRREGRRSRVTTHCKTLERKASLPFVCLLLASPPYLHCTSPPRRWAAGFRAWRACPRSGTCLPSV